MTNGTKKNTGGHAASRHGAKPMAPAFSSFAQKTAAGDLYDSTKFTAAHRTLPFGTRVVVTDKRTNRSVTVTINDRGPFIKGRVIDLSYAAATALRMQNRGVIAVTAAVE